MFFVLVFSRVLSGFCLPFFLLFGAFLIFCLVLLVGFYGCFCFFFA